MADHRDTRSDHGLVVLGDGPGATECLRAAAGLGVAVVQVALPGFRRAAGAIAVLAPRPRALLPAWWAASPPGGERESGEGVQIIIGGGHTGVEAAVRWSARAAHVVLVEADARLLPGWDEGVAAQVTAGLAALGVEVLVDCRAVALAARDGGVAVRLRPRGGGVERVMHAGLAVPAMGLRPDLAGFDLAGTRALADRLGFLQVDSRLETAEPGLHALGAAVAVPLTPAVVARQAQVVASCAAGLPIAPVRYHLLPRVIAGPCAALTAGLTAAAARERGFRVATGRSGDSTAWVACVRDIETGAALGVHAAGGQADVLADAATALLEGAHAVLPVSLAAAFAAATKENPSDD